MEHIGHVRHRIRGAGLKINLSKCAFCTDWDIGLGPRCIFYRDRNRFFESCAHSKSPAAKVEKGNTLYGMFCFFYRMFVKGFATIVATLCKLAAQNCIFE